jgi:diacylglycerol kinase family enzyme
MPQVGTARAQVVTVTASRATPAGADGETLPIAAPLPAGQPLRIHAIPAALRILAPPPHR